MKKLRPGYFPGIAWLLVSTFLLTIPGNDLPKENWLDKIYFDKWVHIGMFSLMVFLWCWATLRSTHDVQKLKRLFILITCLAIVYGIAMEFVQRYWVVSRSFDVGDIIADTVGSLLGFTYSRMRYLKK